MKTYQIGLSAAKNMGKWGGYCHLWVVEIPSPEEQVCRLSERDRNCLTVVYTSGRVLRGGTRSGLGRAKAEVAELAAGWRAQGIRIIDCVGGCS